jgi:amidase
MTETCGALTRALDVRAAEAGPLAGLAFVVKENIDVAGFASTNGHPTFAETHPPAGSNAPVVDRLLAAGARLVGKAHMDEMAYSLLGANAHYGTPVNPRAPQRHPGGSSSGSAVAVAEGLADFALGTDTAGSCRAPASFCGVFGFRPSHGALSSDGVTPLAPSFDVVGCLARDAEILAKVGDVLLPKDLAPGPMRPLLLVDAFDECPFEEASLLLRGLRGLNQDLPTRDARLDAGFWQDALGHFRNLQAHEAHRSHAAWASAAHPTFGPGVAERMAYAATVTLQQKQEADAFRTAAAKRLDEIMGKDGFFVLPTTPFFAPLLEETAAELDFKRYQMFRLFLLASFFSLPQVSLPLKTPDAPLGLSLIGRRWSDRALLESTRRLAGRIVA